MTIGALTVPDGQDRCVVADESNGKRYEVLNKLGPLFKPKWVHYIPHDPTIKQQAFLLLTCKEAFYGGALGGGKSDAILMAALQYVDVPGYAALIIRDTYANLSRSEGLLTRAHEWLAPWIKAGEVRWEEKTKTFHFVRYGSRLEFGYLDGPRDHYNFLSSAYHFVGIDEVVGIRKHQALYLFTRMRKLKKLKNVPIRFRCASNPPLFDQLERGEWVKHRYIDKKHEDYSKDSIFIPASMKDNPHLEAEDYRQGLAMALDPISLRQLEEGDWEIQAGDHFFQISKIEFVDTEQVPFGLIQTIIRRWDMAASEPTKEQKADPNAGPAFTAGVQGCMHDGCLYVLDIQRGQWLPGEADEWIIKTAEIDGVKTAVRVEQEGGSAGKRDMWHLAGLLKGYDFAAFTSTGSKIVRARPLAAWMALRKGNVKFVRGPWNQAALNELRFFPAGSKKDQVDAMASLFSDLTVGGIYGNDNRITEVPSEVNMAQEDILNVIND